MSFDTLFFTSEIQLNQSSLYIEVSIIQKRFKRVSFLKKTQLIKNYLAPFSPFSDLLCGNSLTMKKNWQQARMKSLNWLQIRRSSLWVQYSAFHILLWKVRVHLSLISAFFVHCGQKELSPTFLQETLP